MRFFLTRRLVSPITPKWPDEQPQATLSERNAFDINLLQNYLLGNCFSNDLMLICQKDFPVFYMIVQYRIDFQ